MAGASLDFEMNGRSVRLGNLDKVFYPQCGFTKGQVVEYYANIAPALLAHLRDRALTLKRYADGVEGEHFYQKEAPAHRPSWVATAPVASERQAKAVPYVLCNDLPTLMWLVNLADLEFHPLLSRAPDLATPTVVVFDLDPGAPAGMQSCAQVSLLLKDHLKALDLEAFPKTSGSKGIQVYVPLNTRATFAATSEFALAAASQLQRAHPRLVTANMRKELRTGKVLVDWSQNHRAKTTVCVYSLRAKARPTVSTPVSWREVEEAASDYRARLSFEASEALGRFEAAGDAFRPVLEKRQRLPAP